MEKRLWPKSSYVYQMSKYEWVYAEARFMKR